MRGLEVRLTVDLPGDKITLASGKPVEVTSAQGERMITLDLDVADAVIIRK